MRTYPKDVQVQFAFLPAEETGWNVPFWLPSSVTRITYDDQARDVVLHADDREQIEPGETVTIYLAFLRPDLVLDCLQVGYGVLLYHGFRLVAKGNLTAILDAAASAKAYRDTA